MYKYLYVSKNSFAEYMAYRLNFILWRLRVVISILITYFLWLAIYQGRQIIFNYDKQAMFTYIVLLTFLQGIVFSTQTFRVAEEINNGTLSNYLLRPVNFIAYNLFRDISDKLINTFFSIIEIALILFILRPDFFWQTDPGRLILFMAAIIVSTILYFFINLTLSFIGFWSREVWAPRFIFFIIVTFLAGTYFPLDIFPVAIYKILELLPFTYLIFFPLKIYLGHLAFPNILIGFFISFFWLIALYYLTKIVWHKGLRAYTAEGH